MLQILYKFIEAELKQKYKEQGRKAYDIILRDSARIPLIKIDFKDRGGLDFHFDLIVNNILGVINSKFLSVYGNVPWIKKLGILIKMWGKANDLIGEIKFSSYSMNLLLIHFLIETRQINLIMDARSRQEDSPHFVYQRLMKG